MFPVVYLTGIPGSGKTTLLDSLSGRLGGQVQIVSYSELLGRRLQLGRDVLREGSASVVSADAVEAADSELADMVRHTRHDLPVVIDSHALTYETFGFRAIPFKREVLEVLDLSAVVCLSADPESVRARVELAPEGRVVPTAEQVVQAQRLQEAVATSYAVTLGIPLYVLDIDLGSDTALSRLEAIVGGTSQ